MHLDDFFYVIWAFNLASNLSLSAYRNKEIQMWLCNVSYCAVTVLQYVFLSLLLYMLNYQRNVDSWACNVQQAKLKIFSFVTTEWTKCLHGRHSINQFMYRGSQIWLTPTGSYVICKSILAVWEGRGERQKMTKSYEPRLNN